MKLTAADREALRPMALRMAYAAASFDEQLQDIAGISGDEAAKVREFYIANKIAKTDVHVARITVKHGAFLDRDVILRALAQA